jgi:ribosomal protein L37AE/L43A
MTRLCGWCQTELGEKCPECNSTNLHRLGENHFKCADCHHPFAKGEGGITHTICPKCDEKQRQIRDHQQPTGARRTP